MTDTKPPDTNGDNVTDKGDLAAQAISSDGKPDGEGNPDTRRYLNGCYTWDRVSDSYIPAVKEVAVAHALS